MGEIYDLEMNGASGKQILKYSAWIDKMIFTL